MRIQVFCVTVTDVSSDRTSHKDLRLVSRPDSGIPKNITEARHNFTEGEYQKLKTDFSFWVAEDRLQLLGLKLTEDESSVGSVAWIMVQHEPIPQGELSMSCNCRHLKLCSPCPARGGSARVGLNRCP